MKSDTPTQLSTKNHIKRMFFGVLVLSFSIGFLWFNTKDINYYPIPYQNDHVTATVLKVNECTTTYTEDYRNGRRVDHSCNADFQYTYKKQYYTFQDTIGKKVSAHQKVDLVISLEDPSLYLFKWDYYQFYLIIAFGCFFCIMGLLFIIMPPKYFQKMSNRKASARKFLSSDPRHEIKYLDDPDDPQAIEYKD